MRMLAVLVAWMVVACSYTLSDLPEKPGPSVRCDEGTNKPLVDFTLWGLSIGGMASGMVGAALLEQDHKTQGNIVVGAALASAASMVVSALAAKHGEEWADRCLKLKQGGA